MYMEKLYINIMSCCNFENAKQNAQNDELHQNENKCADHKYVTNHKFMPTWTIFIHP